MNTLKKIQKDLKAPKNQFNKFGGYKYRSCEDILEAVKPLLGDSLLTISDDIIVVGTRVYVKATVTFTEGENSVSVSAMAREAEVKKGMDESQITGAASSYARKYALNGLFLIDDTKDADTQDNKQETKKAKADPVDNIQMFKSYLFEKCGCKTKEECEKYIKDKTMKDVELDKLTQTTAKELLTKLTK